MADATDSGELASRLGRIEDTLAQILREMRARKRRGAKRAGTAAVLESPRFALAMEILRTAPGARRLQIALRLAEDLAGEGAAPTAHEAQP